MRNDDRELKELLSSYGEADFEERFEDHENKEKVERVKKKFLKDVEKVQKEIDKGIR